MFKKLLLNSILILSLIVLSSGSILSQDETFDGIFSESGKYTLDRWRAVRLIEDAYVKRIQDTLIDSLESRIKMLEAEKVTVYGSFNKELFVEREKFQKETELVALERSLSEIHKSEAKKYHRQRNWLLFGIGAAGGYGIFQVLKPP